MSNHVNIVDNLSPVNFGDLKASDLFTFTEPEGAVYIKTDVESAVRLSCGSTTRPSEKTQVFLMPPGTGVNLVVRP